MLNILFPAASPFDSADSQFGLPIELVEMAHRSVVDHSLDPLRRIDRPTRYTAVIHDSMAQQCNFESVLRSIIKDRLDVVKLQSYTQGAVCTCLMAVDNIDPDAPLLVTTLDQIVDIDFNAVLEYFEREKADGGLVTFEAVHPKWSYALLDGEDIIQTAEKRPISNLAIAGVYYFRSGAQFIEAAKKMIEKRATQHSNQYFLSGMYNELVLMGARLRVFRIDASQYHKFYSRYTVEAYETKYLGQSKTVPRLSSLTKSYIDAFNTKDIEKVADLLTDDFVLEAPDVKRIEVPDACLQTIQKLFDGCESLSFFAKNIFLSQSSETTMIEFILMLDDVRLEGVDIIDWRDGKMHMLRAYLDLPKG